MKKIFFSILLCTSTFFGQNTAPNEFTYNEFLGFVKKYHPLVKSANLNINQAQANLLMARGAFDPKIEIDYDKKQFKESDYYSILNSSFKIPTWYGIELKAGFENNDGVYLNPQNTVPNQGLTSLGISIPLGQGLFINQRMADLRKAKIQLELSNSERQLQAIQVLYEASIAYFNWKKTYAETQLYAEYFTNATIRFKGVSSLIINGDKPAIDSVEAGIVVRNRELSLEDAKLKLAKAKLELSNFLWLENDVPLELKETMIPEENIENNIQDILKINALETANQNIENHPKITALQNKINLLEVDRKLKANMLLPKVDLGYSYLSEPSYLNATNFENYKIGVNFSFPIFLRKERGSLQITKFKIQDSRYTLEVERLQLKNKINAQQTEISSLEKQRKLLVKLIEDYLTMLRSEERLFTFGESSIFLINSRENSLVISQLSNIAMINRYLNSNAELFKILANPD
jgi:outer membrane protein TolC